jgi:hypothetical protein
MRRVRLLLPLLLVSACEKTPEEPEPALVYGTVLDAQGNLPLPNVQVTATSKVGGPGGSARTDGDGAFEIRGLAAGQTYTLLATTADYEPRSQDLTLVEGNNAADFTLTRRRVCNPGDRRCAPPNLTPAVLTCAADGITYDSTPCGAGQTCAPESASCVRQAVVSVALIGTGDGTVRSNPLGIACPPDCDASFVEGTMLTLTASPAATTSRFGTWGSGDCAAAGTNRVCQLTLTADAEVRARFDSTLPRLAVVKMGAGSGRVRSVPSGIDCGMDCTELVTPGTMVTLTATPDRGSVLAGWTNCAMAMGNVCQLTMGMGGINVVSTFEPAYLFPFVADGACRTLIHFEAPGRFDQGCGGGPPAVATGTTAFVASRNGGLGEAIEAVGPSEEGAIDLLKPGPAVGPATVEMTVYRAGAAFGGRGYGVLYTDRAIHDATAPGFVLLIHDDGRLAAATLDGAGGSSQAESPAAAIGTGVWVHVAATLDPARGMRLFADGMMIAEVEPPLAWAASSSTAWAGAAREDAAGGAINRFNGRIDELRVSANARY